MSVFLFCVCCLFYFRLFFFKCFTNFRLSRLTVSFNFCPLLLLTTNYCDIYKSITACTFVAAIQQIVLYCIVLYCLVLYCIVLYCIVLYCIVLYYIVLYCSLWHFLPATLASVNFSTLGSFKRSITDVDFLNFLKYE